MKRATDEHPSGKPIVHYLGESPDTESGFVFAPEDWFLLHGVLVGCTGSGKTQLAMAILVDLLRAGRGFAFLDGTNDGSETLLAHVRRYVEETGDEAILGRVHHLQLRVDALVGVDFFQWIDDPAIPDDLQQVARQSWLATRVDLITNVVFAVMHEDDQQKPRLKRVLKSVLLAVGTAVGEDGRHLPLADVFVLLDPSHPRFQDVYDVVEPHLPTAVRSDFTLIRKAKNPNEVFQQTEGPVNRVRELLSPLMRAACACTMDAIDFHRIVREQEILIVSLGATRYVSKNQQIAFGKLVLESLDDAASVIGRHERRTPYRLFVDEADPYIGELTDSLYKKSRGRLSLYLMFQNFSALARPDGPDYTDTILNEPSFFACFQQKTVNPRLLDFLAVPNLDYDRHVIARDRPDGHDFVWIPSVGASDSRTVSAQRGGSVSRSHAVSRQQGVAAKSELLLGTGHTESETHEISRQTSIGHGTETSRSTGATTGHSHQTKSGVGVSRGEVHGQSIGLDESESHGSSRSDGSSHNETRADTAAHQVPVLGGGRQIQTRTSNVGDSTSLSHSETEQHGHSLTRRRSEKVDQSASASLTEEEGHGTSRSHSVQHGAAEKHSLSTGEGTKSGVGESRSRTHGRKIGTTRSSSLGRTQGESTSRNWSAGESHGHTENVGYSLTAIPRNRVEVEEQPELATSIEVQKHRFHTRLCTLETAHAFLRVKGVARTIELRVRHVEPPYTTPEEHFAAVAWVNARLREVHDYWVVPDLSPEAEQRRLDAYVHGPVDATAVEEDENDGPGDDPFTRRPPSPADPSSESSGETSEAGVS